MERVQKDNSAEGLDAGASRRQPRYLSKTGRQDLLLVERHWNEEIKPNLQKRLLKQVDE